MTTPHTGAYPYPHLSQTHIVTVDPVPSVPSRPPPPTATLAGIHRVAAVPPAPPPSINEAPVRKAKTTKEAIRSLFAVDCVRGSRLFETVQFALIYGVLAIFIGAGIDALFVKILPPKDEKLNGRQFIVTLSICLAQVAVSALAVFYMRKLAEVIPPLINLCPSRYVPHAGVQEFEGEIAVAMIFIGVQTAFIGRLDSLRQFIVGGKAD